MSEPNEMRPPTTGRLLAGTAVILAGFAATMLLTKGAAAGWPPAAGAVPLSAGVFAGTLLTFWRGPHPRWAALAAAAAIAAAPLLTAQIAGDVAVWRKQVGETATYMWVFLYITLTTRPGRGWCRSTWAVVVSSALLSAGCVAAAYFV